MPQRLEPFLNKHVYHVFNRTIDSRNIFESTEYSSLFLDLLKYYQSKIAKMSYSKFKRLPEDTQSSILGEMTHDKDYKVDILAYCLMPTHFHLLLRQVADNGTARFVSDVVNSFTRKYNLVNKRRGPLFLPKFKSVGLDSCTIQDEPEGGNGFQYSLSL